MVSPVLKSFQAQVSQHSSFNVDTIISTSETMLLSCLLVLERFGEIIHEITSKSFDCISASVIVSICFMKQFAAFPRDQNSLSITSSLSALHPPPFAVLTGIIFPSDLSSISPPLRRRSTGGLSHSLRHAVVMVHSPFLP